MIHGCYDTKFIIVKTEFMIKINVIVPLCMPMCGANDQGAKPLGAANVTWFREICSSTQLILKILSKKKKKKNETFTIPPFFSFYIERKRKGGFLVVGLGRK